MVSNELTEIRCTAESVQVAWVCLFVFIDLQTIRWSNKIANGNNIQHFRNVWDKC